MKQEVLHQIEERRAKTQGGNWKAHIEGRDHDCGSDFIMTGDEFDPARGEDIELNNASTGDLDFIANGKQDILSLLNEEKSLGDKLLPTEFHAMKKRFLNTSDENTRNYVQIGISGATESDVEFILHLKDDFRFLMGLVQLKNGWE
jgi:hypothetical protein